MCRSTLSAYRETLMPRGRLPLLFAAFLLFLRGVVAADTDASLNPQTVPLLDNGRVRVCFDADRGSLREVMDCRNRHSHIDPLSGASLWELKGSEQRDVTLKSTQATRFTWNGSPNELRLIWEGFRRPEAPGLRVIVTLSLLDAETSVRWRIRVEGLGGFPLQEVVFPRIVDIARQDDEVLAVPVWMGEQTKRARSVLAASPGEGRFEWEYPGRLSIQCLAFYREGGPGLYLACDDKAAFGKRLAVQGNAKGDLGIEVVHLCEAGEGATETYEPPYDVILGVFEGDWFTAAEIYRSSAMKEVWAKDSRLALSATPKWVLETGAWIWNRGRSGEVLEPASVMQEACGLPVSVFWHWWHGCAYDAGFPEYLPPREGDEPFLRAMNRAHERGLHAIVYMNQRLWGMTTASWKKEGADRFAVKGPDGKIREEIYNTFTQTPCASMCMGTDFWRNKYSGIAARAFHDLRVDGIYMDQACSSLPCYDATHGHPLGGGGYWMQGFRALAEDLRRQCPGIALAGEGCGEAWLPHLDMMLSLQVSMERYAGPNGWEPVPFFHAVYHGCGVFYGNYSSLTMPPYDELWPAEFAPKDPLRLLDRKFSMQFRLEQARAFVWGQQPTIANFKPNQLKERADEMSFFFRLARLRNKSLKYLLYGTMLRPPRLDAQPVELDLSRLSIYAGQRGALKEYRGLCPPVLAGAWKASDGSIAFALVNVTDAARQVTLTLDPKSYPIRRGSVIHRVTTDNRETCPSPKEGTNELRVDLAKEDACLIEFNRE